MRHRLKLQFFLYFANYILMLFRETPKIGSDWVPEADLEDVFGTAQNRDAYGELPCLQATSSEHSIVVREEGISM